MIFTTGAINKFCDCIKERYDHERFATEEGIGGKDKVDSIWQMLYPKHYVELSLIPHIEDQHRKDEIHNIAKLMMKGIEESSTDLPFLNIYPSSKSLMQFFKQFQHHRDSSNKYNLLKLSNIFGPYKNKDGFSFIPNMIIIEGAPGMGKTTLCKEIAYQWASNQILVEQNVVLFISLCNPAVKQIKDIRGLIQHFYSLDVHVGILQQYLNENSKNIAIIFDGYDELSNISDESIITKILNRKILSECKIIITSRHTASHKLLNQDRKDAYVRVEILGFTKESREQYIQQELNDSSKASKLQSYLNNHPSIETMCCIPMMMTILVYVFKEKEKEKVDLPADLTNLYETLVACAICRFYQKLKNVKRFISLQDMPKECERYLRSLSKFAFLTLQKHQIVFTEEDIDSLCPNSPLTMSGLDGLGLVKVTHYFSIELPDKQEAGKPKIPDHRAYNFINLSIQEYLAAYFLNSIDQSRQFERLKNTFFSSQYNHMWKMFIAMNKQKWIKFKHYSIYFNGIDEKEVKKYMEYNNLLEGFIEFSKFICQKKSKIQLFCFKDIEETKNQLFSLHCEQQKLYIALDCDDTMITNLEIFIFGNDIHNEWLKIANALVKVHNFAVTVVNNFSLQSCKAKQSSLSSSFKMNNSESLHIIALKGCHITDKAVKSIAYCCSKSEYLKDVLIGNCYFDKNGLREIVNVLSNKLSLSSIKIVDTIIEEESIQPLASTIRNNINLKILQLDNCNLQAGILKIIYAIEGITTLKSLSITNNECLLPTMSDRLATALQSNYSLIELNLANNNLKISAIIILQCVSVIISHLKVLNLEGNHMPKEAGVALESVIANNTGIEILILNNNNLGDGAMKVAKSLKSVTSLKTLDLGNNNLPGSVMNELSQIFMSNKCVERLSLCNNNLKSSIFCVLKSMTTILKLVYLDIRGNQITREAGELIASVIQNNRGTLNILLLGDNNIGKGMMQIVKALQKITSLKVLDLANNNIPKEVYNNLALAITSSNHLEKVLLQGNKLQSSASVILQSLSNIYSIEVLDLRGCQLNEKTGDFVASVLLNNKSLKCLYLGNNNIANGIEHIAKALQEIKSLKLLDLGNNDIPKNACKELALAINSNAHLQKLWLQGNRLHASTNIILHSLSCISDIRTLHIDSNQIDDRGGEILASVIIRNTRLKELHFASNNLQGSVIKILQALQCISTLIALDLSDNNIPEANGSEVAAVIQSNTSLKQLWLHSNNLKSSINVILQALSKLSTLKLLDLHNSHLTSLAAKGLESVIKNNIGLQCLCINDNNLGKGLIIILKALKGISSLMVLNIKNNNFMNDVIADLRIADKMRVFLVRSCSDYSNSSELVLLKKLCIASKLQTRVTLVEETEIALASTLHNNPGLQVLHVDNGCLSQPPKQFTKALKCANSIKVLDLSNFNLSEEIVSELTSSIKSYTLEKVYLCNSNLKSSAVILLEVLATISTLKVLDLQSNELTEEVGISLASVIINNKALEILFLDNNNIGVGAMNIVKALQNINSLKMLGLSNNNLPKKMSHELAGVIKSNCNIESLTLSSNDLRSSAIVILQALSTITTLKILNMDNNQIGEKGGEVLTSVILSNKRLTKLYFSSNNLQNSGVKVLEAFQNHLCLKSLDLSDNSLPEGVGIKLASAIKSNNSLEKLWLHSNNLQSSIVVIMQALSKLSTLQLLDLQNNHLTTQIGDWLKHVITNNPAMKVLCLDNNNIGTGGLQITEALQSIKFLKMLGLSNNSLPKEIAPKLAATIKSNHYLESLTLSSNKLQSSAIVILKSLSSITTLKVLNMDNNQIGEKGGEALVSVIKNNNGVKELRFSNNNLQRSIIQMSQALLSVSTLESLDLSNNNLPREIGSELAAAIQSNNSLKQLSLHSNNLQSSINVILQALSKLSTLELLDLHNSHLTPLAAKGLESVIKNNTELKCLYVNDNNLGKGLIIILKSLKSISSLKEVNTESNNFMNDVEADLRVANKVRVFLECLYQCSDYSNSSELHYLKRLCIASKLQTRATLVEETEIAVASTIQINPGLQVLHVDNGCLSQPPKHFIKTLKYANSIKVLDFSDFNLSEEWGSKLAYSIQLHTSLEKVYLCNSNLKSSVIILLEVLATISTLKVLDLQSNKLTAEVGNSLASVITNNKQLEVLFLDNNNIGMGAMNIVKALKNINSLKNLGLNNNNLPKEISHEIAGVIKSNCYLELLTLSSNNLQSSAIEILQHLTTISTLKVLNMDNNLMGEKAGGALASVILHNTRLQKLYLYNNNLGEGILEVAQALQHIISLESIDLGNNNVPKQASCELALTIKSNKHLERLWLQDNNLCSSALIILQALSNISTLKDLNINNNQIGEGGGEVLASVIMNNTGLRELYISNNNIQNSAMKISEALQCIVNIESLDISFNNLTERVCDKLVGLNNSLTKLQLHNKLQSSLIIILKALCSTTNLRMLELFGNVITEEAGNVLSSVISRNINLQRLGLNLLIAPLKVTEALQNLSALQVLLFDNCNISEEAESKIASVITNNKSLTSLSLENTNLSQNVIQSIMTLSNLTSLYLGDSLLSDEMCDDLSLAISRNKSLNNLDLKDNKLQIGLIKIAKACNKLSNIQVLQLAHNCIIPSKVVELTSIITQNTSLERVLLGGITLNAAECFHCNINEVLLKYNCVVSFNDHTYLEVIYLEMLRKQIGNDKKCFDNNPIYLNAKNFSFTQKLHHYFKGNKITQKDSQEAKEKLAQVDTKKMISSLYILEKVKVIDLENNNIGEDASFELATALHSNNVLEQLWLRGNKLNTAGALYILNSLEYLTILQVLDMSYNNIGSQSADGIAAVIDNNPLINQLWLDGNDLHSTGTITIFNALKKIKTLSILSLCNNGITDDAADELSAVITQNVLLEDLLLSNNQLHSTGIKVIAESLSKLIKLRKLDLFNNNIGKEGASSLAIVIHNSPTLQDLFLSGNNLETSGALEICNALSHINSLHVLTLSNNNISDKVTSQLIEFLNNNHLYAFLIGGNGLECGGLKIAQVIENDNIAMQLLDFSNNNISEQDKEEIKELFSNRASFKLYV